MRHEQAIESRAAERYQLDEMSELERHLFEAHYFSCQECAEEVRLGMALQEAAAAGPATTRDKPSTLLRPLRLVSYAAAAALVAAFGYQTLFVVPALREMARPQALAPVVLRPVSRGADTEVRIPRGAPFLSMSLDVNLDPLPTELLYDLATDGGAIVASGRVAAPAPGTPLLLLLPSTTLADGRHTLSLRPADGSAGSLSYRFVVSRE